MGCTFALSKDALSEKRTRLSVNERRVRFFRLYQDGQTQVY